MRKLLLALTLLAMGCQSVVHLKAAAAGPARMIPLSWRFDCEFPEDRKPEVRQAFNFWDKEANTPLFTERLNCLAEVDVVVEAVDWQRTDHGWFIMGTGYPHLITFYRSWGEEIDWWLRENIERHEIGHVLSFEHSGERHCLMFHTVDQDYWHREKPLCRDEKTLFHKMYDH